MALRKLNGIGCPSCGCHDLRLMDGSPQILNPKWEVEKTENKPGYIRRRRKCRHCGRIIYTKEIIETTGDPK